MLTNWNVCDEETLTAQVAGVRIELTHEGTDDEEDETDRLAVLEWARNVRARAQLLDMLLEERIAVVGFEGCELVFKVPAPMDWRGLAKWTRSVER